KQFDSLRLSRLALPSTPVNTHPFSHTRAAHATLHNPHRPRHRGRRCTRLRHVRPVHQAALRSRMVARRGSRTALPHRRDGAAPHHPRHDARTLAPTLASPHTHPPHRTRRGRRHPARLLRRHRANPREHRHPHRIHGTAAARRICLVPHPQGSRRRRHLRLDLRPRR